MIDQFVVNSAFSSLQKMGMLKLDSSEPQSEMFTQLFGAEPGALTTSSFSSWMTNFVDTYGENQPMTFEIEWDEPRLDIRKGRAGNLFLSAPTKVSFYVQTGDST